MLLQAVHQLALSRILQVWAAVESRTELFKRRVLPKRAASKVAVDAAFTLVELLDAGVEASAVDQSEGRLGPGDNIDPVLSTERSNRSGH